MTRTDQLNEAYLALANAARRVANRAWRYSDEEGEVTTCWTCEKCGDTRCSRGCQTCEWNALLAAKAGVDNIRANTSPR